MKCHSTLSKGSEKMAGAIKHKKTGLICDGNDLNSIYDSVIDFFKNENYLKYGKNAKEYSENFYWNKVIKNYLNLIN